MVREHLDSQRRTDRTQNKTHHTLSLCFPEAPPHLLTALYTSLQILHFWNQKMLLPENPASERAPFRENPSSEKLLLPKNFQKIALSKNIFYRKRLSALIISVFSLWFLQLRNIFEVFQQARIFYAVFVHHFLPVNHILNC